MDTIKSIIALSIPTIAAILIFNLTIIATYHDAGMINVNRSPAIASNK